MYDSEISNDRLRIIKKFYKMCEYHQENIIKAKSEPSELLMSLRDMVPLRDCMSIALHLIFSMTGDEVSFIACSEYLKKY